MESQWPAHSQPCRALPQWEDMDKTSHLGLQSSYSNHDGSRLSAYYTLCISCLV